MSAEAAHVPPEGNRWLPWLTPLAGVIVALWVSWFGPGNLDLGLHLAAGRFMSDVALFPQTDPFTYTAVDQAFINFEWLFDLILYQTYNVAGIPGVLALKLAIVAVIFLSILRPIARGCDVVFERRVAILFALCLVLLTLPVLKLRLVIRPHLVGYALLLLCVEFCRRLRAKSLRNDPVRGSLIALFITTVVWVNCHGSWPLVFALCGLNFLCFTESRRPFAKALGLVGLATLINPYGFKLLLVPFSHLGNSSVHRWIEEWMPPGQLLMSYQLWLVIAVSFSFCVLVLNDRRRDDLPEVILCILLFALAARSYRFVAPALLLSIAPMATRLGRYTTAHRMGRNLMTASIFFSTAFFALFQGQQRQDFDRSVRWNQKGLPVRAVSFLVEHQLHGPVFNDFDVGDFLCWSLPAQNRHAIDGRVDLFKEKGLNAYLDILRTPDQHAPAHIMRYDTQLVLLGWTVPRNQALIRWLSNQGSFALIHLDDSYAVWARDDVLKKARSKYLIVSNFVPTPDPFNVVRDRLDLHAQPEVARILTASRGLFRDSLEIEWLWRARKNTTVSPSEHLEKIVDLCDGLLEREKLPPATRLHARSRRGQALLRLGKNQRALNDLEPVGRALKRLDLSKPDVIEDLKRARAGGKNLGGSN